MNRQLPKTLDDLDTPAVLIEQRVLHDNIVRMQRLADSHHIRLRPHIKTHKSVYLAQQQLAAGASGIAVAKLSEAEVFANAGVDDIQIANQIVGRHKIERLADLAQSVTLSSAVDSPAGIREIAEIFSARGMTAKLLIEVDTGLHRAGISSVNDALALAEVIMNSHGTAFLGLMTHAGHAYRAASRAELAKTGRQEGEILVQMAGELTKRGLSVPVVSVGSTPTAEFVAQVAGVTELRVGNYIFNDMIQVSLGTASPAQCALTVLTTVTSTHSDRAVIDAGSKVLSSDAGAHGAGTLFGNGQLIDKNLLVSRLSEEHGVIQLPQPGTLKVGDRVRVVPNHACPVANLAETLYLIDADRILMQLSVEARGKVL